MKALIWISIAYLILAASAGAQELPSAPEPSAQHPSPVANDGWNRVQALGNGDPISVKRDGGIAVRCQFQGATADSLYCNPELAWLNLRGYRFDRSDVTTVRLRQERRNRWIIVGVSAAAGFALGCASPPSKNVPRALDGMITGGVFALGGGLVAIAVTPFIPGKLIYRRPQGADRAATVPFASGQPADDTPHTANVRSAP